MTVDACKGKAASFRRPPRVDIAEGRRFERLVADLCAALVAARSERIDREIDRWLKQIVLVLDLDRSAIGEVDAKNGRFVVTRQWTRPGWQKSPLGYDIMRSLPWYGKKVLQGEEVLFSSIQELPPEASTDIANFTKYLPKSNFTFPFRSEGRIVGGIAFETVRKERAWPPLLLERLRLVAHLFQNALDRQRAARAIATLREEVAHMSRVTTLGEMSAALAHELNQPLAAILNNAEALKGMLAAEDQDREEIQAAIADIVQDDIRAVEIIQSLRTLFGRKEPKKAQLDPGEMIGEVERLVQGDALIRNVALTVHTEAALPLLFADRVQLQQAVINVVLNAMEAASKDKRRVREVAVEVRRGRCNSVEVVVRDSGPGIAPEAMSRIFEAFFTTKPGGLGMGLAITRSIVEAHGGRLSVSSNSGSGAVFAIIVPGYVPMA